MYVVIFIALKNDLGLTVEQVYLFSAAPCEEVGVGEQKMEDGASRKYITGHTNRLILLHSNDLGSHVSRCSTAVEDIRLLFSQNCQSEISNHRLEGVLIPKENVFQL